MVISPNFSWQEIDKLFLDMDGTLLDKYFDDYFWEQFVPETYAKKNGIDFTSAKTVLMNSYRTVESTLVWTDLDYWAERLGLDIPHLKKEIDHLVQIRPHVLPFLDHMKAMGKDLYLITNAHPKALAVKMDKVNIRGYFKQIICSQDVGVAKEQVEFWDRLQQLLPYDRTRTIFADDTENVLFSAKEYGIRHLVHIAKPSSKLATKYSTHFPSIASFGELPS